MKKIIILVVPLLLTAAGGAFFFLGGSEKPADGEEVAEAAEDQVILYEPHFYFELKPITATIFRADQPSGVFTAAVTLEIADESLRPDIFRERDKLRDAMFRELHAMFEREEYTGRKVDVDAVKRRMLVVSQRELGKDVVLDVFVNTLMRKGA